MWPFTLKRQPFKALYIVYELLTVTFIRAPFWLAVSIPSSWRPRPSWDIKRVLAVRFLKHYLSVTSKTGLLSGPSNHLAIGPPGPDVNGIWVDPAPSHLVVDPLRSWAQIAAVAPIRIPGYWLHTPGSSIPVGAPPMPGEKVVYALHGGGYTALSAHPAGVPAHIPRALLAHCPQVHRVFALEYRISARAPLPPANPFPAALLDALAGYIYLVAAIGFAPDDIILEGDSAGGNLALALTRYLVARPTAALPAPPGALLLFSPWTDLGQSHNTPGGSETAFQHVDFVDTFIGSDETGSVAAFLGPHGVGAAELNPYVSPASARAAVQARFAGFPRTFIAAGTAEVLYDQIRTLQARMVRDMGAARVVWHEARDGIHDYVLFGWHEPERGETLRAVAAWVAAA